jgi:Reverse transcriptase (RNA-dependent DNA polymerase)
MYTGFQDSMLTDQGSLFTSADWHAACNSAKIRLRHTGTESHNSLGAGERYHSPLRRIFKKVSDEYPSVSTDLRLSLSVNAMNDCVGPEGLVPSLLVFGVMPRLPDFSTQVPSQIERFKCLFQARREYEQWVCKQQIRTALKRRPPPASSYIFSPGDQVAVYRERVREFKGPYVVTSSNGKDIKIELGESTGPLSFNISQIKPWPLQNDASFLPRPQFPLISEKDPVPEISTIHWTESIYNSDPRTALFDEAKRKELFGLIERGIFRLVLQEDIGPNPNVIPSRFVRAVKHESGTEKFNARFVLGGYRDREKKSFIHNSTTLKHQSVRLILALASIFGFELWSSDVNQAYLQSAENLQRNVFAGPNELELAPNELLQLILPLYGITESGDYWGETLTEHQTADLKMTQTTQYFSLFAKHAASKLIGLSGAFVDDLLRAGTLNFKETSQNSTKSRFDVKPMTEDNFTFAGFDIRNNPGHREISQNDYIKRLKLVPAQCRFGDFRTVRAKLQWASHTMPAISFAASRLDQTTATSFSPETIKLCVTNRGRAAGLHRPTRVWMTTS